MTRPPLLPEEEVDRRLAALPGWTRTGRVLERTFTFAGYPDAVEFVRRTVEPAERLNHHPDMDVRYNRVLVRLSTHDVGGLTALDLALAEALSS
jgi:4a-hydroxytetrahydrobiopterin dehydratase